MLKSEYADIFSSEPDLWLLRHTDEPQSGRNSCLWLQSRSVLSSFGVALMSCRDNFHVVRSAFNMSTFPVHVDTMRLIMTQNLSPRTEPRARS